MVCFWIYEMRTGITVGDAMTKMPVTVKEVMTVEQCARIMKSKGVGSLLVTKGEMIVGIATEKDLVLKVLAGKHHKKEKISKVMTKKLVTIEPHQDLYDAMMLMRDEGVRRLPVVRRGELVGMLTANDMLKMEPQLFDYVFEMTQIREEQDKIKSKSGSVGVCEQCGVRARVFEKRGQLLCRVCA